MSKALTISKTPDDWRASLRLTTDENFRALWNLIEEERAARKIKTVDCPTFPWDSRSYEFETLRLLCRGPIWDGNLPSKAARDNLVGHGLVFRREGYQSLTTTGVLVAIKLGLLSD